MTTNQQRTGAVIWQTHVLEVNREGYSAPVLSEAAGVRQYVVSFADSLVAVAADDGRLLWRHPRQVRVAASYTPMERLLPQFEKLPPGARIVSHQFSIPGIRHDESINLRSDETGDQHRLFLWTTPLRRAL
jgi:hypothetical protein